MKRLAVLAGGPSCEREVSLVSGRAVVEALAARGYDAVLVDAAGGFIEELKSLGIGHVFNALHGTFGEDGTVQRILEKEGIFYTGAGAQMSETAFDKSKAQALFQKEGLRVPPFFMIENSGEIPAAPPLAGAVVVKPAKSGSSVGIRILKDAAGFREACLEAFRYSDRILVEKFIAGRELTVGILGQEVLPPGEVIVRRAFYDYEAKYGNSGTRYEFPAKLNALETAELSRAALGAYRALGGEVMARVDFILDQKGEAYVLEANTIPGLTPKSLLPKAARAAGIDFPDLCVKIISLSMARMKAGVA